MKIGIFYTHSVVHREYWCTAFAEGLKRHGEDYFIANENDIIKHCDLAVFWGMRKNLINLQEECGNNYLVLEVGYWPDRRDWIDKENYDKNSKSQISIGYNGLNGRASFCNYNSPDDRFKKKNIELKDWNIKEDGYVVVMGQISGDASVSHININEWYEEIIKELLSIGCDVRFRKHPLGKVEKVSARCLEGSLSNCFDQAMVVVTFNSNSGVEAVLEGIPTVSMDRGSMAWDVTSHDVNDLFGSTLIDRRQWVYDLAYTQWNRQEITSGLAWEHLKQGV